MSDVYCTKCGEPWEIDTLHEAAKDQGHTFGEILAGFRAHGCSALSGVWMGAVHCNPRRNTRAADASGLLFDLLGDDVDGVAAMLEDLGGVL